MRKLLLLALVGLVLALGLAVPFSELKDIAEDFGSENPDSEYMDIKDEEFDEDLIDHDREDAAAENHDEDSYESDDDEDDEADTAIDKTSDPQIRLRLRPIVSRIQRGRFMRRVPRQAKKRGRIVGRRPRPERQRLRVRRIRPRRVSGLFRHRRG